MIQIANTEMEMEKSRPENHDRGGSFWTPFLVMLALTPFLLSVGVFSAGAGHGDYFLAKLIFPFTMLSTLVGGVISLPFFILGILQFPTYGVVLGLMNRKAALTRGLIAIGIVHIGSALAALVLIGENFS